MNCDRKTAIFASLGFGAIPAVYALEAPAPEPAVGILVRGFGAIINASVAMFGQTGAAAVFMAGGVLLAIVSAAVCPSARARRY